ncbi:hypothetical protein ACE193_21145 [Bernardetia sp. OM2101]|uniref:hypothetical protein n=1 Tax=Bernardetia sp. OM2101 TaxID=3344876 RepID=UPI0035CEC271
MTSKILYFTVFFISLFSCASTMPQKKEDKSNYFVKTSSLQNDKINFISCSGCSASSDDGSLIPLGKFAIENRTNTSLNLSIQYGSYTLANRAEEYYLPQGQASTNVKVTIGRASGTIRVRQTYRYRFYISNGQVACQELK